MNVTYTLANGAHGKDLPKSVAGRYLAEHAIAAYGHVLNTPNRRGRPHNAKEFANAIAEVYDVSTPETAVIVDFLRTLWTL